MSSTTLLSLRVPDEVAERLAALAEATDRSKSCMAAQAIEEYLALQEWQVKAIRKRVSDAETGKLVVHKEALKVLRRPSTRRPGSALSPRTARRRR